MRFKKMIGNEEALTLWEHDADTHRRHAPQQKLDGSSANC